MGRLEQRSSEKQSAKKVFRKKVLVEPSKNIQVKYTINPLFLIRHSYYIFYNNRIIDKYLMICHYNKRPYFLLLILT
jgi:hypothetical protein